MNAVQRGIIRLLTDPTVLDCDEADSCSCRQCRHSEPMRPTITERIMRFTVERVTEPLVLKHITASELWSVREWGRRAHFVAIGGGRMACTSDHENERPANTDADCAEAVMCVKAYRLNEVMGEPAS